MEQDLVSALHECSNIRRFEADGDEGEGPAKKQ